MLNNEFLRITVFYLCYHISHFEKHMKHAHHLHQQYIYNMSSVMTFIFSFYFDRYIVKGIDISKKRKTMKFLI